MKIRKDNYESIEPVVDENGKYVLIIFVGKKTGMDVQISRLSLIEGHTEVEEDYAISAFATNGST